MGWMNSFLCGKQVLFVAFIFSSLKDKIDLLNMQGNSLHQMLKHPMGAWNSFYHRGDALTRKIIFYLV